MQCQHHPHTPRLERWAGAATSPGRACWALVLIEAALHRERVDLGRAVLLSWRQTETGQGLTGRLCRHGETGVGGCALAGHRLMDSAGLRALGPPGVEASKAVYEDHVTHSSAAQSGGLLL